MPLNLGELRRFLGTLGLSHGNQRTVMEVVGKLARGDGITHGRARGTFYARGPGPAHANSSLAMDMDFHALREAAKLWLPPRPRQGVGDRFDQSRGWTIDHPIGRLILFQRHKLEELREAGPTVEPAPETPKRAGKRARSTSPETVRKETELLQQLAVAHAEPQALEKLSLHETRLLKRELQAALARCQRHEEKLEGAEKECIVCCDSQRTIAFGPCGHMCSCHACAQQMQHCPLCQGMIKQRMRIFDA